jgi:alpha-tubulin suppressor-like RCC1 family protein
MKKNEQFHRVADRGEDTPADPPPAGDGPLAADGAAIPAGAAFVASSRGEFYHWTGSRAWRDIPPLDRVWFPSEETARRAGYEPAESSFERLEDFEILGELGRGGTSIVYHARDRALGREVAIKVIQASFEDEPETVARFAQEARLLAGLRHPGIVSAFSVKQLYGGGLALVMEHVRGRTLREVLRDGPLPIDRVDRILRDVGEALAAAHEHGIVHRDVKPDNIFLEDSSGRALLADFGIALRLDSPSGLTRAGTALGTPTYMSPEQIDGREIDGRSDLYGLALIGWEMLAGETPWKGESLYGVIYKQKHEALPALRHLRPDVPVRLWFAIEGALAKDPRARWADVGEFLSHLADESLSARWRHWSSGRIWQRRASARVVAAGARVESAARGLETVLFRRPAGIRAEAVPEAPEAPTRLARRSGWRRSVVAASALAVALAVGLTASLVGIHRPAAPPDVGGSRAPLSMDGGDPAPRPVAMIPVPASAVEAVPTDGSVVAEPDGALSEPIDTGAPAADGTEAAAPVPEPEPAVEEVRVPIEARQSRIAVGGLHTCQADPEGAVLCWGGNDRGQLGAAAPSRSAEPLRTELAGGVRSVFAGAFHTCALSTGGIAHCWGENQDGQLGGGGADPAAPVRIARLAFHSLSLGASHTCGLARDGRAYCWGSSSHGQLGDGSVGSSSAPVRVRTDQAIAAVVTGWSHSCALTREGRVLCWGQNASGQLGDGSRSDRRTPTAVAGDLAFRALAAGSAHTCGLTTSGEAYCWGQNSDGRLGDGTTTGRAAPVPVRTTQRFVEISAGARHTCGLTRDGSTFCWGHNNYGQLGSGETEQRATPVRVATDLRFGAIRSSGSHTCGVTTAGAIQCWGYNIEGQLGDGTRTHRSTPRRVERVAARTG